MTRRCKNEDCRKKIEPKFGMQSCCDTTCHFAWQAQKGAKDGKRTCDNVGCNNRYKQHSSLETWCSPKCGYEISQLKLRQKDYLQAISGEPKSKPNESIAHQKQLTQDVFNKWVRVVKEKDATCCISCRRPRGAFHEESGHYKTVGSAGILRYEPDNCHLQCNDCNQHKSGNVAQYRIYLIEKIGIERVEWLETECNKTRKYKLAELKDWRAEWSRQIREVEQSNLHTA